MRTILRLLGVLLMLCALLVGAVTAFLCVLLFDPPHPGWQRYLSQPPPGPFVTDPLDGGEYVAWMGVPSEQSKRCTVAVRRGDGSLVGHAEGTWCVVHGKTTAGERWTIEATSSDPDGQVFVGHDSVFAPPPMNYWLYGSELAFGLGIATIVMSFWVRRDKPATG
jgi:hypothetical protein